MFVPQDGSRYGWNRNGGHVSRLSTLRQLRLSKSVPGAVPVGQKRAALEVGRRAFQASNLFTVAACADDAADKAF